MTEPCKLLASAAALALLTIPAASVAQSLPPPVPRPAPAPAARGPSLDLALEAAQTALAACAANGYVAAVAVIDSGGSPKVILAADGARPITVAYTTRKALASNKYKVSSREVLARTQADPAFAVAVAADTTIQNVGGALPIMVGPDLIGSIGVGGAGNGGKEDEDCARAGLNKVMSRLK